MADYKTCEGDVIKIGDILYYKSKRLKILPLFAQHGNYQRLVAVSKTDVDELSAYTTCLDNRRKTTLSKKKW